MVKRFSLKCNWSKPREQCDMADKYYSILLLQAITVLTAQLYYLSGALSALTNGGTRCLPLKPNTMIDNN